MSLANHRLPESPRSMLLFLLFQHFPEHTGTQFAHSVCCILPVQFLELTVKLAETKNKDKEMERNSWLKSKSVLLDSGQKRRERERAHKCNTAFCPFFTGILSAFQPLVVYCGAAVFPCSVGMVLRV